VIDIEIKCDTQEINKALGEFPEKIAKKVLRKGAFSGAVLVRDRLKIAAPIRREGIKGKYYGNKFDSRIRYPGFLRRMIGAKYNKKRSDKWTAVYNPKPLGMAYYGFFVEGGHRIGKRLSRSKMRAGTDRRGHVPAHPFMATVFRNAANESVNRMKVTMEQGILKEWASTGFQGFARP
jgi:hypothetical protein